MRALAILLCTFGLPIVSGCTIGDAPARPPDVLLVIIDTLRADRLGSYGYALETSPTIDELAAQGVLFERGIAAAPSTVPSHAAIMTSRHVREVGAGWATGEGRLVSQDTLAAAFRSAGYATAAFVSNVALTHRWGFRQGFDVFDDELNVRQLGGPAFSERIAERTTRRALTWLESVGDEPFFLWVHYQDPHGPYKAPAPFDGQLQAPRSARDRVLPVVAGSSGFGGIPGYVAIDEARSSVEYGSRYADEILYADHWLSRLLEAVDARGRQTVVLLTSDHGEAFGEGNRWFTHGTSTTPELAHVPFILRAPDIPRGRRSELVGHVDVMPTLLELAGIERPSGLRGLALGPFLRGGLPLPDRALYCDRGVEVSAYRGDSFVRIASIGKPRVVDGEIEVDLGNARWRRYAWNGAGRWKMTKRNAVPDPPLLEFIRSAVIPERVLLDPQTRTQLQALGYLDP